MRHTTIVFSTQSFLNRFSYEDNQIVETLSQNLKFQSYIWSSMLESRSGNMEIDWGEVNLASP